MNGGAYKRKHFPLWRNANVYGSNLVPYNAFTLYFSHAFNDKMPQRSYGIFGFSYSLLNCKHTLTHVLVVTKLKLLLYVARVYDFHVRKYHRKTNKFTDEI